MDHKRNYYHFHKKERKIHLLITAKNWLNVQSRYHSHTHTHTELNIRSSFLFFTFNATSTSLTDFDCKVKSGRRTDKVNCDFGQKKEKRKKTFLFILSVAKVRPKKRFEWKKMPRMSNEKWRLRCSVSLICFLDPNLII
jgi:hypothetical protein